MSIQEDLAQAHRLIMQAALPANVALVKGVANRRALRESIVKLKSAIDIIEGVIGQ